MNLKSTFFGMNKFSGSLFIFSLIFLFQACSTTEYSLREPHMYMNSYQEVIDAVDSTFAYLRIEALEDQWINENTYEVYFLPKSSLIDERDRQQAAVSKLTIRKIEDRLVSIQIEEEKQEALVRNEYQTSKAKEIFKELKRRLSLKLKTQVQGS